MMRKFLLGILFLSINITASAQQFNSQGHPLITNFSAEHYNGTDQTWSIVQDDRGVMYFGTWENGILEYDGFTWRKIPIPDNKPIYSLAKGDDGTIYVGSSGDFGYLEPTAIGGLQYVSLLNLLNDSIKQDFTQIFKTYVFKGETYFCSKSYIFIYDRNNIDAIYLGDKNLYANFLTFICNDKIYVGSYIKGLRILNGKKFEIAPGAKVFENKNIYTILPYRNNDLLVITNNGFYRYNSKTGESEQVENDLILRLIRESFIPYNSILLSNGTYGVGNVQGGWVSFLELADDLKPNSILNKEIGLQSNIITSLYQDGDEPAWATFFDGGVSKIEINSNFRKFAKESGIDDMITDIIRFNGTLYISTANGVYFLKNDINGIPKFLRVKNIYGVVWDLLEFKTTKDKSILLAGSHNDGIFEIKGDAASSVSEKLSAKFPNVQHNVFSLYQSTSNPQILYIGMTGTLASATWRGDWVETKKIMEDKLNHDVRGITEDKYGNLWLSSQLKGVKVISNKGKYIDFSAHNDLVNAKDFYFLNSNDTLFLLSNSGIFHYNYIDSSFTKGGLVNPHANSSGIFRMQKTQNGFAAVCSNDEGKYWAQLIDKDSLGKWSVCTTPFKRLPKKSIDALFVDDDGTIWIGISKELYSYNPNIVRNFEEPFRALIRKVVAKDSVLFEGCFYSMSDEGRKAPSLEQQSIQIPRLSYHYNGVVINFSSPYFEREADVVYSHYLEGSDEESWSKWDSRTETTYTNLREGKYTFYVKAKNVYEKESIVASYSFEIRPPWYRTILAFFIYFIFFIALVWAIVKWNTRRLIEEKIRLEEIVKQRTAEVVAQKEEIEIQNEKIAAQNEEIKSSIHYASRIQGAILTPPEQINRIFPDNFILYLPRDIVSGDFYYITQIGSKKISVVADCTGHGVPGGFMSMLGVSFLTQIISQTEDLHAATILNKLRHQVITALHQTGEIGGSKDGMDLALYILDEQTMHLEFAGANNPLVHISNGELNHIKSDKMPIGIHLRGDTPFTNFELEVKKGDVIYTFSDGYADQFGGSDTRKFMIKNLKEMLLQIHQKPMDEQREILHKTLLNWHGDTPRIDDVVLMGVRI